MIQNKTRKEILKIAQGQYWEVKSPSFPGGALLLVSFSEETCDQPSALVVSMAYYANNFFILPQLGKIKNLSRNKLYLRWNTVSYLT